MVPVVVADFNNANGLVTVGSEQGVFFITRNFFNSNLMRCVYFKWDRKSHLVVLLYDPAVTLYSDYSITSAMCGASKDGFRLIVTTLRGRGCDNRNPLPCLACHLELAMHLAEH